MKEMKKIVIFGGSGFLGQALCQAALAANFSVVSISHHGKPVSERLRKELIAAPVEWIAADIFTTTDWQVSLTGASAIIDLIGILKEKPKLGITYQKMIVEAARIIGEAAADLPLEHFIFLSANAGPAGYIEAKRTAESRLINLPLPLTIIRPGLLVGRERPSSIRTKWGLSLLAKLPLTGTFVHSIQPLRVELVATKIIQILTTPKPLVTRVIGIDELIQ